jgi:hypothetical protein
MELDIDTLGLAAAAFAAACAYLGVRASLKARVTRQPRLQLSTSRSR